MKERKKEEGFGSIVEEEEGRWKIGRRKRRELFEKCEKSLLEFVQEKDFENLRKEQIRSD